MQDSERVSYLKTLMYIAAADDDIDERELDFFVEAGLSSGLSYSDVSRIKDSVIQKEESLDEIAAGITEDKTKRELICDLLTLCYLDGSYSVLEQVGMRAVCDVLEIDESRLVELEAEAEESAKKGKNPFYLFKQSKTGSKMLSGLKKAYEGSKVFGSKVKKGSSSVAHSVSMGVGIVGTKISNSVESAKKLREENKALREKMKKETVSEKVKQRVITQLHSKITALSAQLKAEKERNNRNEEMINLLQAQIDDLMETMAVAENAKTA